MSQDFYKSAKVILGEKKAQRKRTESALSTASMLPLALKDEFRKREDPAMSKAIRSAEQKTLGGAIEGINKYKEVVNPFERRALAEKYQGSLSKTYTNLTDERTRRTGVIQDYINMFAGSYGAIAKGEQVKLQGLESEYADEMRMGGINQNQFNLEEGRRQSQSNWERSFARSGAKAKETKWTDRDIRQAINESKKQGKNWEEIANQLAGQGIDVNERSIADNELRRVYGLKPVGKEYKETPEKPEKDRTPKQRNEDKYYKLLDDIQAGNSEYDTDEEGNIIKKEKGWWFDIKEPNKSKIIMQKI